MQALNSTKLILRWDELEKEDRAKESNALPGPTDYGVGHTVHELIEWVGALQRLGGADKASTLELMKKIAEERGLPMLIYPFLQRTHRQKNAQV